MRDAEYLSKAIVFATEKHRNQTRKDGTPYIWHPLKVAEMVKDAKYGIKYQVVAILHDVLEDTDATEDEIEAFGGDILEAVKLLSRPVGADEEVYVEAILQNHMAAVVKNADKIHNLLEVVRNADKGWLKFEDGYYHISSWRMNEAEKRNSHSWLVSEESAAYIEKTWECKYIRKAQKYYYEKFSYALDRTIEKTEELLYAREVPEEKISYLKDRMKLHSDVEKEVYLICKEKYENCTSHPDFTNPNMQYWYDELVHYWFCFTDNKNVWNLSEAGWLPLEQNPLLDSENGSGYWNGDRQEVEGYIQEKIEEDYFFDFVDLEKL